MDGSRRTVRRIRDVERAAIARWLVDERERFADDVRAGTFKPGMHEALQALGRLTAEEPECADFILIEDDAPIAVLRVERSPEIIVKFVFRPRTAPPGAGAVLVASVVDAFVRDGVKAVYAGKHSTLVGKHLLVRLRFMALSPAPGESFAWRLPAARWRAHRAMVERQLVAAYLG